jgi:hypothetical protein
MKNVLTMLCSSIAGLAFAQTNLVYNYSFEDTAGVVECISGPTPSWPNGVTQDQEDLEEYWAQIPPWTVPAIGGGPLATGAGSSDHFCDGGNTGPKYGSTQIREYICAPLRSPLVAGRRYLIEFYVKSTSTLINAGIKFSDDRPRQRTYYRISIDGQPHFEIDNNQVFSWSVWTRVRGYYVPDNDYDWMSIGTFDTDSDEQSTFAIDDITIVEWPFEDCPTIQRVENYNFDGFTGITLSADDQLHAGYDVGASTANGNVIVPAGSAINFKAGNQVGLFPGFQAEFGSEFHAYNAPCGSDCFTPAPTAGISTTICDGGSYGIGGHPVSDYTYIWVADPQNAVSYLSSTTVSDPVFTPPPGEGDVRFYVIAINTCGEMGSNEVSIHYDDTPSPVAQFSLSNVQLGDEPSFDVVLNADIETVSIEVLDPSLTTLYYRENFQHLIDFQCCLLRWMLPTPLSPCVDYKIRVKVTNYCTGAVAEQILDWNRNRTLALTAPVPNVITPNDDGINDRFCVSFTGAAQVSLDVKASSGVTVFYTMTNAYPPTACLWNGECNQGLPACVNGPLEDGTYYYILKFFDCGGASHEYTGFITLLNGVFRMQQAQEDSVQQTGAVQASVFPNPSTGRIAFVPGAAAAANTSVIIYNSLGQVAASAGMQEGQYVAEFDLSFAPAGVYYLHYYAGEELRTVRFVIDSGTEPR